MAIKKSWNFLKLLIKSNWKLKAKEESGEREGKEGRKHADFMTKLSGQSQSQSQSQRRRQCIYECTTWLNPILNLFNSDDPFPIFPGSKRYCESVSFFFFFSLFHFSCEFSNIQTPWELVSFYLIQSHH